MPLFRNRDQKASAASIMKNVLFGNGQLGWERTDTPQADLGFDYRKAGVIGGPVYGRTFYDANYPDLRRVRGCIVNGTRAIAESLGIAESDIRFGNVGSGKNMGARIEIAAGPFEEKIAPKLGVGGPGDLDSNLAIVDFGKKR